MIFVSPVGVAFDRFVDSGDRGAQPIPVFAGTDFAILP
jgi:hypothetical protein